MYFRQLRAEQPEVRAAIYNQIHRKQQYPIRKTARKEHLKLQGIQETAATVKDDEKVSGSGTSKSDTSDTTASSSADSKDADSTVKKNSSDSKSSAKNSTSTAVKHNSTQSTGASNAGTKTNKAADSSTAASNTTSQGKSEHTHTWVKYVANTIQHKEEGHYETKVVKAAYDEPQYDYHYVCLKCGKVYVVDQAAYTENVYGERCSGCGATK